ncbi:urease accessory protein UreD [Piscinibacter sp. XHJ-5]|uniref:urease accessory protein UreD n=1 Tax=Piscinibacter sp. XHJ-5 TaxID=3037797 RepID=UPI002452BF37|nr:urease accessory protein UreD [Piscinibacter sp. XHJ-5]
MGWLGRLDLHYRREGERTRLHDRHRGPLRVLQSLYPEAPAVCHNVLVHPPGGIVGGDVLEIAAELEDGAHALLTTPGAARFYRSAGDEARQSAIARVGAGARLEWLPLETICHRGARGSNHLRFELAPGAEMIGWDLLALGLPASGEAFDHGRFVQHIELPGTWLERGIVDGADTRLLRSPLGWAAHAVSGTMWLAAGVALDAPRREALLDGTRELVAADPLARTAGATAPSERVVVLRVLAPRVEPMMKLMVAVWKRWRQTAWQLAPCAPRIWSS